MKSFLFAVSFLTTLPVNLGDYEVESWRKSTLYYPVCGYIIGIITCLIMLFFQSFVISDRFCLSAVGIFLLVILTGGLHLDGLADFCDGFFCPADKKRKLAIMKDSRVGTFGVIGIVVALIFKFSIISVLIKDDKIIYLIPALVFSRLSMNMLIHFGKPAQPDGMGAVLIGNTPVSYFISAIIISIPALFISFGSVFALLAVFILSLLVIRVSKRAIGGLTGDVIGFNCELSEILAIFIMAAGWL